MCVLALGSVVNHVLNQPPGQVSVVHQPGRHFIASFGFKKAYWFIFWLPHNYCRAFWRQSVCLSMFWAPKDYSSTCFGSPKGGHLGTSFGSQEHVFGSQWGS